MKTSRKCRNEIFKKNRRLQTYGQSIISKIRKELKIDSMEDRISEYRTNWINHIDRMESTRLPKKILKNPCWKKKFGSPQEEMA